MYCILLKDGKYEEAQKHVDELVNSNYSTIFKKEIIEINYQPDCTRACKFVPEFYNDIFSTLFFEKDSGKAVSTSFWKKRRSIDTALPGKHPDITQVQTEKRSFITH